MGKVQNGRKKKKSDANVKRKFGIMKWSQSLGGKMGSEYFVIASGWSRFPHKQRENVPLKDNERRQTLAYKDAGMTKDGRWDKQMRKKKDNAFL